MLGQQERESISNQLETPISLFVEGLLMPTALLEQPKALHTIRSKYPSVTRSKHFPEIKRLAHKGDGAAAEDLAKQIQARNPRMRIENIISRRMRVERASFFQRLAQGERDLKNIFKRLGNGLADTIERKADKRGNLPSLYTAVRDTSVEMGRQLRTWVRAIVRDSAKAGLKNAGDAFLHIFKDNLESVMLKEEKLSFGLDNKFANLPDPRVGMGSVKWKDKISTIVKRQANSTLRDQKFSDKIWEIKTRSKMQMKKLLVNEIEAGSSPANIARKIQKYLSPSLTTRDELSDPLPPGVYASPYKNALRVARTEAGKAYTNASAEFAKNKTWIIGLRVTLSPAHDYVGGEECEDHEGKLMTPDEFQSKVPFHPNCMCFPTYEIDPDYLAAVESEEE